MITIEATISLCAPTWQMLSVYLVFLERNTYRIIIGSHIVDLSTRVGIFDVVNQ